MRTLARRGRRGFIVTLAMMPASANAAISTANRADTE
jgi:hypothetical protein